MIEIRIEERTPEEETRTLHNMFSIYDDIYELQDRVAALETIVNDVQRAVLGEVLKSGQDLDDLNVGFYIIPTAQIANSLLNRPSAGNSTGYIRVVSGGAYGQLIMYYVNCHKNNASYFQRVFYSGSWGDWHEINLVDTGWIDLELENDVRAYNEGQKPQYRKINNVVFIRGAVTNINATNTVIATLPTEYRPKGNSSYVQNMSIGTNNYAAFSRMMVGNDGKIKLETISENGNWGERWFPINTSYSLN